MVVLTLLQLTKVFAISQYMHVGIAGLIAGIVPAVLVSLATRPRYYGQPGWERVPTAENREEVHLKEADLKVLGLIRQGFENMSELSDVLGMDASRLNEIIEKLDRGGYLVRQSLFGSGFYTFAVSDAGEAALPKMSEVESALAADRLTPESLRVLRIVQEAPGRLADLVKSGEFTSLKVSAILAKLIRNGYVREGGLFKRTLAVSEAGSNLLEKYRGVGVSA
jgi:SSS family solute:Na+ symporter